MARLSKAEKLELADISSDPVELESLAGDENADVREGVVMTYNSEEEDESDYIISVLDKIIGENLEHFKQSNEFKVRPGYSYDRFFLDRVEGSYDESLYGLIHHIMFKDGVYKELLTDEQYELCKKVVEETPELIWYPPDEDEDYESVQDMLDEIYNVVISHVCERLKNEGFELEEHQYYMEGRGGY